MRTFDVILKTHHNRMERRQTDRVKGATNAALALLGWLEVEGFIARGMLIEAERMPVVDIALSSKCEWLKKQHRAYIHRIDGGIHMHTWRADIMGCRVQWIERGN